MLAEWLASGRVLGEEDKGRIALRRMEGYTTEEFAAQLDVARRTVERKQWRIRKLWAGEATP
jgi:hypothetical protein